MNKTPTNNIIKQYRTKINAVQWTDTNSDNKKENTKDTKRK